MAAFEVSAQLEGEFSDPGLAEFGGLLRDAILAAAQNVVVPAIKKSLMVQGPPRSWPFTPPHIQSEKDHAAALRKGWLHLIQCIHAWLDEGGNVVVGCKDNPYGIFLEIGTRHMLPRPWLAPTLNDPDVQRRFAQAVIDTLKNNGGTALGDIEG